MIIWESEKAKIEQAFEQAGFKDTKEEHFKKARRDGFLAMLLFIVLALVTSSDDWSIIFGVLAFLCLLFIGHMYTKEKEFKELNEKVINVDLAKSVDEVTSYLNYKSQSLKWSSVKDLKEQGLIGNEGDWEEYQNSVRRWVDAE